MAPKIKEIKGEAERVVAPFPVLPTMVPVPVDVMADDMAWRIDDIETPEDEVVPPRIPLTEEPLVTILVKLAQSRIV